MEYKYTIFNPNESKVANEILNTPLKDLIKRYIKRRSDNSIKFFNAFNEKVNEIDEEEYLINPYIYDLEGSNLNYVANQVFIKASKIKQLGFEFKLENVVRDLDRLFGEYSQEVDKITKESKVQPISRDIANFFVSEILNKKILTVLENNANINKTNLD